MSSSVFPDRRDTRRARAAWALVSLFVAFGLWLRECGLAHQLPTTVVSDERVYFEQIEAFESGVENPATSPRAGFYPHLPARLALVTWRATHGAPRGEEQAVPAAGAPAQEMRGTEPERASVARPGDARDVAEHLARSGELHTHVRRLIAWLSLLALPAAYLLVRTADPRARASLGGDVLVANPWGARRVAVVASALVATSMMAQLWGQMGRPHAAFLAPQMLAVAAAIELARKPTFARALLAGAAIGWGVSILQTGLFLLGPLVVALVLASPLPLRRRLELFGVALVPIVGAFVWAYPFLFVEADADVHPGHGVLGEGAFGFGLLTGTGFLVLLDAFWSYEPLALVVLVVAAGFGSWGWVRQRPLVVRSWLARPSSWSDARRTLVVISAFVVPYVIAFGLYERTFPRYALPLVPFTAWGLAAVIAPREREVCGPSRTRARVRVAASWGLVGLVVILQGVLVVRLARVRAAPDTLAQAASWIRVELPHDARIGILFNDDVPLLRRPEQRAALVGKVFPPHQPWLAYQSRLGPGPWDEDARDIVPIRASRGSDPRGQVEADGVEYVLLRLYGIPWRTDIHRLHAELTRGASLVAVFRAIDDDDDRPFVTRDQPDAFPREGFWLGRLLRAERVGPVVQIWKIEP